MIVKNEEKVIARCLQSVQSIIDSYYIIDTGSTDQTIPKIQEHLKDIPGAIIHRPWVNFGHNRTELVQRAKNQADYLLLLDADMEVISISAFDKNLDKDAYLLRYTGNVDYAQKLFVKSCLNWKYVGVTHEYIYAEDADPNSCGEISRFKIKHHCDGINREVKFYRDIVLLIESIEKERNGRDIFYLAQSYRDIQNFEQAYKWYQERSRMDGWNEETWYALYQMARLASELKEHNLAAQHYLESFEFRPTRMEPLYWLSRFYRDKKAFHLAYLYSKFASQMSYPSSDVLFIDKWIYDYGIWDELAIDAFYTGRKEETCEIYTRLLNENIIPEHDLARIHKNRAFSITKVSYVIPYTETNPRRKEALHSILKWLQPLSYEIIIMEQDIISKANFKEFPNVKHVFIPTNGTHNKEKALNIALRYHVSHDIIVISDCDCTMNTSDLQESIEQCCEFEAVNPFFDILYLDENSTLKTIENHNNLPNSFGDLYETNFCAGIVIMQKQALWKIAGWEEQIGGWGAQDRVQNEKVFKLLTHKQMPFRGYHLNHPREGWSDNCSNEQHNATLRLWYKFQDMPKNELEAYCREQKNKIGMI